MGVRGEPSKTGAQSALLFVPLYSTSFRCGTKGFVCHAKKDGVHSTLFIVPPNCAALVRGTEGVCFTAQFGKFGQFGRRGSSRSSHNKITLVAVRRTGDFIYRNRAPNLISALNEGAGYG